MKGEIRKLSLEPKTLDNAIVKDGLQAASLLNNKEQYYVVGGIASQSYLPTRCRRPTSDIDFSIVRALSYGNFKEMVKPLQEYLGDSGYKSDLGKGSGSYRLNIQNSTGERVCLEFARRSKGYMNRNGERLLREFENSNMKIVEERDTGYRVACPEDIAIPKIARLIGNLRRNPDFKDFIPKGKVKPLSESLIEEQLENIKKLRTISMANTLDSFLFDRLRFVSDLYDIRILSEITGFNENYWSEGIKWFNNSLDSTDLNLVDFVLPFNHL